MRPIALLSALVAAGLSAASPARADDAKELFRQALRHDLDGGPANMRLAVDLYRRAAEAGLPEAQFNVAVMLDSGRGVTANVGEAAVWYARAAAHGNKRAAFNLGQLYETGEGVPRNPSLARAWFSASDLPAAKARLAAIKPATETPAGLSPASLIGPPSQESSLARDGVEFVWTSSVQPDDVRYFVEIRAVGENATREIYAGFVDTSSLAVSLAGVSDDIAWRVTTVSKANARYAVSAWSHLANATN